MHRIKSKILREIKANIRPELHDRVNAIGCGIAVVGSLLLLATLAYDVAVWVYVLALCMWAVGLVILVIHTKHK